MKTNQFLTIIIAALLLLLIIFGLSKLIPRDAIKSLPQPSPSPQADTSPSPSVNTYTNSDYGFSFTLPNEDWEVKDNLAPALPDRVFFIGFAPKGESDASVTVEVKHQPAAEVIKNFRTEVSQSSDSKITIEREVRLGKQYIKQISLKNSSSNLTTHFRFAEKDSSTYIISGQDPKLLDAFSFTTPTSSPN